MAYEKPDKSGVLFKNDRKQTDKHPDYTGDITLDGVTYWLNGWKKDGQKGTFLSLSVGDRKDAKGGGGSAGSEPDPLQEAMELLC